ncbi:RHS repeat-associated core domain-containing protein [Winogradskyella sp. 3972H.M.0a.05]|uniref:RHS repeat-associated core domain-containing protein n=1 Tax=Winogradskyella sp. 3972H.M.0a.05 TaxID=2950277 RepID=UPI0033925B29
MLIHKRYGATDDYRYGFQGQEKDDEIKGKGNSYDYGNRFHDPRVGRWLSLDAVSKSHQGNYNFASNSPKMLIDKRGDDDYYYDAITNSMYVIRNSAPHRFFFTEYIYSDSENGICELFEKYKIIMDNEFPSEELNFAIKISDK